MWQFSGLDFQFKFSGSLNLGEWFLYSVSLPPGQHGTIQFGITESVGPRKWAHSVFTFSLFNSSQALFAEQHAHKLLPTTLLFIMTNWQYPRNTLRVVRRVFEIEGIPFLVMLPPAWQWQCNSISCVEPPGSWDHMGPDLRPPVIIQLAWVSNHNRGRKMRGLHSSPEIDHGNW